MKTMRTILMVLFAVVALVVVGLTLFVATFDANSYRALISEQVEEVTGLKLNIAGELEFMVWPNIELQINQISLEDPSQEDAEPLLEADRIDGKVALLPLLQRDIQINSIVLQTPTIRFTQGPDGHNWQTLTDTFAQDDSDTAPSAASSESEGAGVRNLAIDNFSVAQGTLDYTDNTAANAGANETPSKHSLTDLDAQLSLSSTDEIQLELSTILSTSANPSPIALSLSTQVRADDDLNKIAARDTTIEFSDHDATLKIPLLTYDQAAGELEIQSYQVNQGGLSLSGAVTATQLADLPKASGRLVLDNADLAQLLEYAEIEAPADLDTSNLGLARFETDFSGNADGNFTARDFQLNLEDLGLTATGQFARDTDEKITGTLALPEFAMAALQKRLGDFLPDTMRQAQLPNTALDASFSYDPAKQGFNLRRVDLKALDLAANITGAGTLDSSDDAVIDRFSGHLNLENFSPKQLLKYVDAEQETSLESALTLMNLDADITLTQDVVELKKIRSKLDKSAINGELRLTLADLSDYRFDLSFDEIELTDYLAPEEPEEDIQDSDTSTLSVATLGGIPLPTELLSSYRIDGQLQVGRLGMADVELGDAKASIKVADGRASFGPLSASMYGGGFAGKIDLRAATASTAATLGIKGQLKAVAVADLLIAVADTASLTGKTTMNLDLLGEGDNLLDVTRSADGSFDMQVSDGQFTGLDLGYKLCELYNRLKSKPLPPQSSASTTTFENLRASANVTDGVAYTDDVLISNDYLSVTGKGRARLARQSIDYDLDVKLAGPIEIENCETLSPFVGQTIPVKVTGTFDAPEVRPDFGRLVVQQIRRRVEEKITDKLFDIFGGKKKRDDEDVEATEEIEGVEE